MKQVKKFKRKLDGVVVSAKSAKTIVVRVESKKKHSMYSKFLKSTSKYHAHDESKTAKEGDRVQIIESRPYSALKRWELLRVYTSGSQK